MHSTLKKWGEWELKNKTPVVTGDRLSLFQDDTPHSPTALTEIALLRLWRESFVAEGHKNRAEQDAALLRGEEALKKFFAWWSKENRSVLAVERGFKLTLPDKKILTGRFDRVEEDNDGIRIIDFKTSAPLSQDKLDSDVQLSIYALAAKDIWKKPVRSLILLSLQEEECIAQQTTRNESQLKDALRIIEILGEGIELGDFKPTPSTTVCSRCPYKEICPASVAR